MPLTKEQLLAEAEDLLRNVPALLDIVSNKADALSWLGRFSAVIHAWDYARSVEVLAAQQLLSLSTQGMTGYRRILTLLNEARHALRMQTVGPLSVPVPHGAVFDYFDEVRKIIETAKQDLLFVDPYLDAEFVPRYLAHVSKGVAIRLLAREKLPTLLPAVFFEANRIYNPCSLRAKFPRPLRFSLIITPAINPELLSKTVPNLHQRRLLK